MNIWRDALNLRSDIPPNLDGRSKNVSLGAMSCRGFLLLAGTIREVLSVWLTYRSFEPLFFPPHSHFVSQRRTRLVVFWTQERGGWGCKRKDIPESQILRDTYFSLALTFNFINSEILLPMYCVRVALVLNIFSLSSYHLNKLSDL